MEAGGSKERWEEGKKEGKIKERGKKEGRKEGRKEGTVKRDEVNLTREDNRRVNVFFMSLQ